MEIKHDTVFKVAPDCDNYIHKSALRKLADELRAEKQHHSAFTYKTMKECWEDAHRRCAAKIDALIGGK